MKVETVEQAQADSHYRLALIDLLTQLADDELCLGHRDSEWLGLAPDIEEDVAFSSIAQDEVGHASFFYERLHELGEAAPDELAFSRPASERKNTLLVEGPNGDWAMTIVRHYLYDTFDAVRMEAVTQSGYVPLADGARKIQREERYHQLHLKLWFTRLLSAGGEARERMERAVQHWWPCMGDLFSLGHREAEMVRLGILPWGSEEMRRRWEEQVRPAFQEQGLPWPGDWPTGGPDGRQGEHTEDLVDLIRTMSEVKETDPAARW
jgi:ring-1,2-phenylacetyl-CoA epoxidase subunit PaaC